MKQTHSVANASATIDVFSKGHKG